MQQGSNISTHVGTGPKTVSNTSLHAHCSNLFQHALIIITCPDSPNMSQNVITGHLDGFYYILKSILKKNCCRFSKEPFDAMKIDVSIITPRLQPKTHCKYGMAKCG